MTGSKSTYWQWIRDSRAPGGIFRSVGIRTDGTLINPNGYPEDLLRAALDDALERQRQRRSEAARKAARTRAARREKAIYKIVARLKADGQLTPGTSCEICGKALSDPESLASGIGSDCWQKILKRLEEAA